MKILTMCQGGNSRSVAMAYVLKHKYKIDALACGWESNTKETLTMLFNWAEKIIIMESSFIKFIPQEYRYKVLIIDVGPDVWFSIREDLLNLCDHLLMQLSRPKTDSKIGCSNTKLN